VPDGTVEEVPRHGLEVFGSRIFVWAEKLGELRVMREMVEGGCGHRVVKVYEGIDQRVCAAKFEGLDLAHLCGVGI